ncbi:hypothetical protein [Streptomyces sp. NPDC002855]|uniref:hypothetical protein n=1 Tax=Streptomyces sp. NPDC002855 TaxID=3154437 RepID=UPI0033252DF2
MPVTNLRFNITSSWDGGGMRSASRALSDVDRDVQRVGSSFGKSLGGLLSWRNAAIALAPAMFTLGKHALALAGGVAALGVAAGAAAAPWIGLAVTAAKNADEMGSAGKAYQTATDRVKNAWMDLAKRTAPLTLGPMTDVLEGVSKAIPKLEPLVRDIAPVFEGMGKSIKNWLSGNGFERFLNNVREYGVPAFRNLVDAGKDFLATAGIGFRAFLPLAVDISEALKKGSSNLREWAEGGGFDRFLKGVKREWPTVKKFLSEAGESIKNIGGELDKIGPGQLGLLGDTLEKFNDVDIDGWKDFLMTLAAVKVGGGLLGLLSGLANIQGGRLTIGGGAALGTAAAGLTGAGLLLLAAAAALSAAAKELAAAGASVGAGGVTGGIGNVLGGLGGRLAGGSATFRVTIEPPDAAGVLTRIRDLLSGMNGKTATMSVTLNATAFTTGATTVLATWARVRAAAAVPAIFRAMAFPGNVMLVAAQVIAAWMRVRMAAAVPAIFRASAFPGNVVAVAGTVIAAWSRVRAAAASVPMFRAMASPGNVPGVAAQITAAWARVRAAAAVRPVFTAIVIPGPAVAGSAAIVAAWMRVLAMPRSWSATATVNSGGAVSGANAARSAWQSVLSMPRSVTFTVNIVTKKSGGNAEGGPPAGIPGLARGGRVFGPGGPMSDRIPAMLSRGEWVIRARAVKALGPGFMNTINSASGSGGLKKMSKSPSGGRLDPGSVMAGGDTHVHFHGSVYAVSEMEFQEKLAHSLEELDRKHRAPWKK